MGSAQCVVLAGPYIIISTGSSICICASDSPRRANDSASKGGSLDGTHGTTWEESSPNKLILEVPSSDGSDITSLAIDQSWSSPSHYDQKWSSASHTGRRHGAIIHVAAFHRSGHFDVFSVAPSHPRPQHQNNDHIGLGGALVGGSGSDHRSNSASSPNFDARIRSGRGVSSSSPGFNTVSDTEPIRASIDAKLIYSYPAPPSVHVSDADVPPEVNLPHSSAALMANIMCAAYHHPLLITLSKTFHLLVYYLPHPYPQMGSIKMATSLPLRPVLVRSVYSYTSYPPSSMSLARVPVPIASSIYSRGTAALNGQGNSTTASNDMLFKLVLAYTVPVYPAHWTAAAAELAISVVHSADQTTTRLMGTAAGPPDVRIVSSRTASAMPTGWHEMPVAEVSSLSPLDDEEVPPEGEGGGDGGKQRGEDESHADMGSTQSVASTSRSGSASASKIVLSSSQSRNNGDPSNPAQRRRRSDAISSTSTHPHVRNERSRRVRSTYTALAPESAAFGDPMGRLRAANAMEQWGRKVSNVVGTQTDGKWIVIAGNDNILQVSSAFVIRPLPDCVHLFTNGFSFKPLP